MRQTRRARRLGLILAGAARGLVPCRRRRPRPAPRIDMKVLLLGTSTTEPDFQSWQAALQREGVPFDTIVALAATRRSRPRRCRATLADGTPEAQVRRDHRVGGRPAGLHDGTCVSDLSAAEWTAIEQYEQSSTSVRSRATSIPGAAYGLNAPTVSGRARRRSGRADGRRSEGVPVSEGAAGRDGHRHLRLSRRRRSARRTSTRSSAARAARRWWASTRTPTASRRWSRRSTRTSTSCRPSSCATARSHWATRGVYFGDQRNYLRDEHRRQLPRRRQLGHARPHHDRLQPGRRAARGALRRRLRGELVGAEQLPDRQAVQRRRQRPSHGAPRRGRRRQEPSTGHAAPGPIRCWPSSRRPIRRRASRTRTRSAGSTTPGITRTSTRAARPRTTSRPRSSRTPPGPRSHGRRSERRLGLTSSTIRPSRSAAENPGGARHRRAFGAGEPAARAIPGQVDPPSFDSADSDDDRRTLPAVVSRGQRPFTPRSPIRFSRHRRRVVGLDDRADDGDRAGGSVTLTWEAVCHAADYKIYREIADAATHGRC